MVKCNNCNCGFEKKENVIQPCPKCGYVMHLIKDKKEIKEKIKEINDGTKNRM